VIAGISLRQGRTVRCPVCQDRYRAIGKVARQRVDQDPGALYEEWMIKQRADRLAWNKLKRNAERMALFETIERAQLAGDTAQAKQLLDTLTPTARHRYMRWRMARIVAVAP
jgi:hypothetical protein